MKQISSEQSQITSESESENLPIQEAAPQTSEKKSKKKDDDDEEETTLIDLLAIFLSHKVLIIAMTSAFAVFSVVFSVISLLLPPEKSYLPNQFTIHADMLINDSSGGSSSSLSSMLGSSGAALARLAGVSVGSSSPYSEIALYIVTSRELLDALIDEFNLYERFKFKMEKMKSPRYSARKILTEKMLSADYDEDSGIFSISCTDYDPYLALDIVNYVVAHLEKTFLDLGIDKNLLAKKNMEENIDATYNEMIRLQNEITNVERSVSNVYNVNTMESISTKVSMLELELKAQQEIYTQLKAQYELLKIEMASQTPVLQTLSKAEIPDRKSKPARSKICIALTFVGGVLSFGIAFLHVTLQNLKNNEEAMQKLRGKPKAAIQTSTDARAIPSKKKKLSGVFSSRDEKTQPRIEDFNDEDEEDEIEEESPPIRKTSVAAAAKSAQKPAVQKSAPKAEGATEDEDDAETESESVHRKILQKPKANPVPAQAEDDVISEAQLAPRKILQKPKTNPVPTQSEDDVISEAQLAPRKVLQKLKANPVPAQAEKVMPLQQERASSSAAPERKAAPLQQEQVRAAAPEKTQRAAKAQSDVIQTELLTLRRPVSNAPKQSAPQAEEEETEIQVKSAQTEDKEKDDSAKKSAKKSGKDKKSAKKD